LDLIVDRIDLVDHAIERGIDCLTHDAMLVRRKEKNAENNDRSNQQHILRYVLTLTITHI